MKNLKERVISSVLVVAMAFALFPVSAGAYDYNPQKSKWVQFLDAFLGAVGSVVDVSVDTSAFPDFTFQKTGSVNEQELYDQCKYYNSVFGGFYRNFFTGLQIFGSFGTAVPAYDANNDIVRPQDKGSGEWIVDSNGEFPYFCCNGDVPAEFGAGVAAPPSASRNKFINVKDLNLDQIQVVVLTQDALAESVQLINEDLGSGVLCTMVKAKINDAYYWVIMKSVGTQAAYYCNSSGMPYVALAQSSATDIKYDYIDNTDNSTTINDSQIIQIDDGILNIIDDNGDKIQLTIDSLTFDTGTKNYTVNAYNTTYEGDEYHYTYYTYNITYNITNTYINYIGSNSAYEKEEYQYYYQLPDGRSSADLTADEVAGMSFEFHDVVNYAKSATDVSVRALYHFDGDTDDSSYFSTQGAFTWKEGASITYMEAPAAFDGTLYLDTTAHAFDFTLPSSLGSGDFTLQFRHYQASEPDTQENINNSLSIGGNTVLKWDEQALYYGSAKIAALPIGTWSEIALVRHSGTLYIYLNGLCIHSAAFTSVLNDTISFSLGETSRSYTMLDELRVVNFAVAESGKSYTPTAVPFDSNLVLVLPDSAKPVADEYYEWDTTITPVFSLDLTGSYLDIPTADSSSTSQSTYYSDKTAAGSILFNSAYSSVFAYDGFSRFACKSAVSSNSIQVDVFNSSHVGTIVQGSNIAICLSPMVTTWQGYPFANDTYTITLVDTDLQRYSFTFAYPSNADQGFSWGTVSFRSKMDYDGDYGLYGRQDFLGFNITPGKTLDLMYIEMVPGTSPNTGHEKVTCIYPETDVQPNTAAVQSDIPVNGYTVGGVRPTLPARGDCWFPVSGGRIQTCYIYNGSMWEEVGCRWYTGSRWIPIYAFDLETLEDLFDIADAAEAVTPITSQEGFWRWWQLQWLDFREWLNTKFDALISAVGGTPGGSASSCEHEYSSQVTTQPSCAQPGYQTYTCSKCGHQYTEIMDATGHDWICTNSVPEVLDEDGNVVEKGYDEMTCSVCGATAKDYGDGPEENDLFDALGDFIADGISWVLDKLAELVESLTGITDAFRSFVEKVQSMAGDYPAFFGAFVALIPEELSVLLWFAVTAFVVVAVWKKWTR